MTSNELDLHTPRFWDGIKSPVPDVAVELNSASGKRLTETDQHGRFVFDGLGEGEYSVFIYSIASPDPAFQLEGPRHIKVEGNACSSEVFLVHVPKR